jgi:hypothetical protein
MIKEQKRIIKYIIVPDDIETRGSWSLADKENMFECDTCGGHLFYVRQEHGIVDEEDMHKDMKIMGWQKYYALRVIGLATYCAECGEFQDDYWKYFYPKDNQVCTWDDEDLNLADIEELQWAIHQYNTEGKITMGYKSSEIKYLESKISEYEAKKPKARGVQRKKGVNKKRKREENKNGKNK